MQKKLYWGRKKNVGILAKMLRKRASKLGMVMREHVRPQYGTLGTRKTLLAVWTSILTAKYSQNEDHRKVLLSTAGKRLIERDNRAKSSSLWGAKEGSIEGRPDRLTTVGINFMGKLLSRRIRDMAF